MGFIILQINSIFGVEFVLELLALYTTSTFAQSLDVKQILTTYFLQNEMFKCPSNVNVNPVFSSETKSGL
jgi:hypothetical protein